MENKKIRERKLIDEIAEMYIAFPAGEIIESERPDFLVKQNLKVIGIELVDYIRGQMEGESAERRNEILWQKVADKAKEIFEAKHNIPLVIHFRWNDRHFLRQAEILQFAQDAVRLVENQIPAQLSEPIRIGSDEIDGTLLDGACHSITVTRVNTGKSFWSFISSGWIEAQDYEIQHLIDSKNHKAQEYLQRCDEIWLIIIADWRYITSHIHLPELTANNIYNSYFTKVLVYDRLRQLVLPLKLKQI